MVADLEIFPFMGCASFSCSFNAIRTTTFFSRKPDTASFRRWFAGQLAFLLSTMVPLVTANFLICRGVLMRRILSWFRKAYVEIAGLVSMPLWTCHGVDALPADF